MTVVPEAVERENRLRAAQRFLVDNPVVVLVGVLVLLFVLTDLDQPQRGRGAVRHLEPALDDVPGRRATGR